MLRVLRISGLWAAMGFMLIAALSKLADLPEFAHSVATWDIIPRVARSAVAVGVPLTELTISCCWLLGLKRRAMTWGSLVLITAFTLVIILQWVFWAKPTCGCLGAIARYVKGANEARWMVARNAILLLILGCGTVAFREPVADSAAETGSDHRESAVRPRYERAFTLVECVITVALVGLLAALLAPSLTSVRARARDAASLSNLRNHAAIVASYGADFRDLFPSLTDAKATRSVIRCESAGIAIETVYFEASRYWRIGLADQYYDGRWDNPSFFSPRRPPVDGLSSYLLSCTTVADPSFYTNRRQPPPKQLRPIHQSEVVFPSLKGVFIEMTVWFAIPSPTAGKVLFLGSAADGSGVAFKSADLLRSVFSGDGPFRAYSFHFPATDPFLHTEMGVLGRDLRGRR